MQAEQRNQLIFVLREIGVAARDINAVLIVVDGQLSGGEHTGIGDGGCAFRRPGVADGGADARKQLLRAEGLGQIIVRACVEGFDLVALVAAGGDDQNGDLRPFPDVSQDRHAVHIRQAEVENDDVRTVRCDHGIRHRTRAGHKHVVAVCRQDCLHKAADGPLVLDQKNLISDVHGCFPPMAMKIAAERRLFSGFPHASYRRAPARWTYIQTGRCPYCAAGRRSPPDRG